MPHRKKTAYFNEPGEQNTNELLKIVEEYVKKENVTNIIVASSTGETGAKFARVFKDRNTVVVTHAHGYRQLGKSELQEEFKREILANGGKIFTGTHALSSAERTIRSSFGTVESLELIANTLRLMGQGTKVCVEITLMAMDAGLIAADQDVVAVGGTGSGADTALLIKPANASRFFGLQIKEVLAKPSSF